MMVADPEFDSILIAGSLDEIRAASTKTSQRLTLYSKLIELHALHGFCSDVDMFLQDHSRSNGVHFGLTMLSLPEIMQRLRQLGLWEVYVHHTELEAVLHILSQQTLPQLAAMGNFETDIASCGSCWNRDSYRA